MRSNFIRKFGYRSNVMGTSDGYWMESVSLGQILDVAIQRQRKNDTRELSGQ
jgi:hypothetical protein